MNYVRPDLIIESESIWDRSCEMVRSGRNVAIKSILTPYTVVIKEVGVNMSLINTDTLLATIPLLEKSMQEKIALDIVYKHELGCTCPFCEQIRSRFPPADASNPDLFASQGGENQSYPFDASNTVQLQVMARSSVVIAESIGKIASSVESLRDVLRGRDSEDKPVRGPIRAIADHLLGLNRPAEQAKAPPQTQRAPAVQQTLPTQASAAPAQSPYAAQKRIATDAEMLRFKVDQKVRFNPTHWPGEPRKGYTLLQCEPNFLEVYADQIEWFAQKAKEKVAAGTADENAKRDAQWGELNAAQYRRLAADMRAGKVQQSAPPPPAYSGGADTYD